MADEHLTGRIGFREPTGRDLLNISLQRMAGMIVQVDVVRKKLVDGVWADDVYRRDATKADLKQLEASLPLD